MNQNFDVVEKRVSNFYATNVRRNLCSLLAPSGQSDNEDVIISLVRSHWRA